MKFQQKLGFQGVVRKRMLQGDFPSHLKGVQPPVKSIRCRPNTSEPRGKVWPYSVPIKSSVTTGDALSESSLPFVRQATNERLSTACFLEGAVPRTSADQNDDNTWAKIVIRNRLSITASVNVP